MEWNSLTVQELMQYHEDRLANLPDYDSNESSESLPDISFETSFDDDQFEHELYTSNESLFESADAENNIEPETNQEDPENDENNIDLEVNQEENEINEGAENNVSNEVDVGNEVDGEMDKDVCTICLEDIEEDKIRLPCDHVYHGNCIQQWLRKKRTCPICRSKPRWFYQY